MIDEEKKHAQAGDGLAEDAAVDEQLATCLLEVSVLKEQVMRERADFDNFKKRTDRERVQWIKSGQAQLLNGLLEIVDNFDRALAEGDTKERTSEIQSWVQGFEMIRKELNKFLQTHGVEVMAYEVAFNPERHEALMHVESADHKSGEVVGILQKGYLFKGDVLRPAKVSVAK